MEMFLLFSKFRATSRIFLKKSSFIEQLVHLDEQMPDLDRFNL